VLPTAFRKRRRSGSWWRPTTPDRGTAPAGGWRLLVLGLVLTVPTALGTVPLMVADSLAWSYATTGLAAAILAGLAVTVSLRRP
jgi:hypothetical protein